MDLDEFYNKDTHTNEIQVVENQLVLAKQLQYEMIGLEKQKKLIEETEKELKAKLEDVMSKNNISSYETNDKKIKISYTPQTTMETLDKDKLFTEFPEAYRACMKDTPRKASVRITIREEKENEFNN